MRAILLIISGCLLVTTANAQGYVDQEKAYDLVNSQTTDIKNINKPSWHQYEYNDHIKGDKNGNW